MIVVRFDHFHDQGDLSEKNSEPSRTKQANRSHVTIIIIIIIITGAPQRASVDVCMYIVFVYALSLLLASSLFF